MRLALLILDFGNKETKLRNHNAFLAAVVRGGFEKYIPLNSPSKCCAK